MSDSIKLSNLKAKILTKIGNISLLGRLARKIGHIYREGSIVKISSGYASGMPCARYHNYVNGYWVGIYELPIQERITKELEKGIVFFDIGANAGFFSLVAARAVGDSGKVIAFEPLEMNYKVIKEHFRINNLSQCESRRVTLSDETSEREMILPRTKNGLPSVSTAFLSKKKNQLNNGNVRERFQLSVTSMDEFIKREGIIPDLIKIDVDGAEGAVLRGAQKVLRSEKAPRILIEIHGNDAAMDVNDQLLKAGYRFSGISGNLLSNGLKERHYLALPPGI
jgi:FkbM family methyltransferase